MDASSELVVAVGRWASAQGLPSGFAAELLATCPWLDGKETMSEHLAPQLLGQAFSPYGLGAEAAESFCSAYNAYVERDYLATVPAREAAFAAMEAVLAQYGPVGLRGTFWLVDDSFSTDRPLVVVYDQAALSEHAMRLVAEAAASCPEFKAVLFSDEEGHNAIEVPVARNDALYLATRSHEGSSAA